MAGLVKVPQRMGIDATKLASYIQANVPEIARKVVPSTGLGVQFFRHGESNPTYLLEWSNGPRVVLRRKPPGKLLRGAHRIDREYRMMSALHSVGFPVPQPIHYCNSPDVIGTEFYLMEYVQGRVFRDVSLPELTPEERAEVYTAATTTLCQLHSIDVDKLNLGNFGRKSGYCYRQIEAWKGNYIAAVETPAPEMLELAKWLESNVPEQAKSTVVHGDYRLGNLVFDPVQPKVTAVLDWEICALGDPLADVGFFAMTYLPFASPLSLGESVPGIPDELHLSRIYAAIQNLPHPIPRLNFYQALSCFRIASIIQGVVTRGRQGNASSDQALMYEAMIVPMAEAGLQYAARSAKTSKVAPFHLTPNAQTVLKEVTSFIDERIIPAEKEVLAYFDKSPENMWTIPPILEELKVDARKANLWNLFLPGVSGFTQLEYAPMAEEMGRSPMAPEVFNCSAPDTGNMELLYIYGSEEQKDKWLKPLLDGSIRSCFSMSEPGVASSDATNISCSIVRDGNYYVVNGLKWWSSGAGDPRCKFAIVMGVTNPDNDRWHRQSMIIVPLNTPGVKLIRPLSVLGFADNPHGHFEIEFDNVRVPASNLIGGEGRGFEIAQGRLGPGRIHHCMRSIGMAERALELMIKRSLNRTAFGKLLAEKQLVRSYIAKSRIEIDQARMLVLNAASAVDRVGGKSARKEIACIKVAVPRMACQVVDRAIQVHGAEGLCQDVLLGHFYSWARALRIADGPDEVHMETIAKEELRPKAKL